MEERVVSENSPSEVIPLCVLRFGTRLWDSQQRYQTLRTQGFYSGLFTARLAHADRCTAAVDLECARKLPMYTSDYRHCCRS